MQGEESSPFGFWSTVGFLACVAVFLAFGEVAGVRVAGALTIGGAIRTLVARSIPVGIRGRPTSYYLTGIVAVLAGLVMAFLGILLLAYPEQVLSALISSRRRWHT